MADSAASGPLHMLQGELTGARSQWDALQDRIINGYKDAYKLHFGVLQKMEQARLLEEQEQARIRGYYMFVFNVVSVGFAGGIVGGVIGNWLRSTAAQEVASHQAVVEALAEIGVKWTPQPSISPVVGEGIKGIGTQAAKDIAGALVPKNLSPAGSPENPYAPASADPLDVYLDKKGELDETFGLLNERLQDVINLANKNNWSADLGWSLLNSFRKNCPVLVDAPRHDQLPGREQTARASELAMWAAWANVRDFDYWNPIYFSMDRGALLTDEETVHDISRLEPVLDSIRRIAPGKVPLVVSAMKYNTEGDTPADKRFHYRGRSGEASALDLRKLAQLRLQAFPDQPFTKMKDLDFGRLVAKDRDTLQLRGNFLDGLRDIRPFHVH